MRQHSRASAYSLPPYIPRDYKVSQGAALAGLPPFIGGLTQVLRLTSRQFGCIFLYASLAVLVSFIAASQHMETQEKWQPLYMVGGR